MKPRIMVALSMFLCAALTPLHADPPDPPSPPVPNEDVLRPRLPGSDAWFGQIGVGLNFTLMSGNPAFRPLAPFEGRSTLFESASGIGPLVYGAIGYRYSPTFSMRLRLDMDKRLVGASSTLIDTCALEDTVTQQIIAQPVDIHKEFEVGVTYVTVSLLPTYHMDDLELFAGLSVSTPLSRNVRETDQVVDLESPCFYLPGTFDQTKVVEGTLPSETNLATRVSVKLGAGYSIRISPSLELVPELALDLGLTDTFLKSDGDFELMRMRNPSSIIPSAELLLPVNNAIRLNSLQATIGVRFGL